MRSKTLKVSKNKKYNDFEDMEFRMNLPYSENEKTLDIKFIDSDIQVNEMPESIFELVDLSNNSPFPITNTNDESMWGTFF